MKPPWSDGWTVIVPVKRFARAKTRLDPDLDREAFARAFASDTTAAVAATLGVVRVLVVTDEPGPVDLPAGVVVLEQRSTGLSAGIEEALTAFPLARRSPVAVVLADLPSLTPGALGAVFAVAARESRSYVPDLEGQGTTVLTAASVELLAPAFGAGSAARHRRGGAVRVDAAAAVRRDVDTPRDLLRALQMGVGPRTNAVAQAAGLGNPDVFPAVPAGRVGGRRGWPGPR